MVKTEPGIIQIKSEKTDETNDELETKTIKEEFVKTEIKKQQDEFSTEEQQALDIALNLEIEVEPERTESVNFEPVKTDSANFEPERTENASSSWHTISSYPGQKPIDPSILKSAENLVPDLQSEIEVSTSNSTGKGTCVLVVQHSCLSIIMSSHCVCPVILY